ncbi:MAG: hypothetical protein IMZ43_06390 [Thermoplasmata archaeon]|nr:hypothetical protein [Thermoplasmata archaeon]
MGHMSKVNNSILVTRVIEALFTVVGRRTLDSFAIQILKTTTEKLENKFDFLRFVKVHDDFFLEEGIKATIDSKFDTVEPARLGEAIDTLVRVIYMELTKTIGDDVGLYFITELKDNLGDLYVDELRGCGVHLDLIQMEQHMHYQMKGLQPVPPSFPEEEEQEESEYTWDTVSTWKYDNNVCLLYDGQGKLLDTLKLDLIIEEYIERVTEEKKHQLVSLPKTTMLKVTEKENELLEMMRRRDTDVESAVTLLHISRQKFDTMIQKLLQLEMLQYISDNEVKLTEKGLQHLSEHKK